MADDYDYNNRNNNNAPVWVTLAIIVAVGLMFVAFNNDRAGDSDITGYDTDVSGPATPGTAR